VYSTGDGSSGSCECLIGYTFNSDLGLCFCDPSQGFYLNGSNCVDCNTL
jgi:hypothetical protein